MKKLLMGVFILAIMAASIAACKREAGPAQSQQEKYAVVKASGGLNMRSAPTVSAERLMSLPAGSRVKIVSFSEKKEKVGKTEDFWAQVEFEGKRGWVFNGFLEEEAASVSGNSASTRLEVRSQVMREYVEDLARDKNLQIELTQTEFWFFIYTDSNGKTGYRCNVICGEGCENPPTCDLARIVFENDRVILHVVDNKILKKKCVGGKSVFTSPEGSFTCEDER